VAAEPGAATILYRDAPVTVITEGDVSGAKPAQEAARTVELIKAAVHRYHSRRLPARRLRNGILFGVATVLFVLALAGIRFACRKGTGEGATAVQVRMARILAFGAALLAAFGWILTAAALVPVTSTFGLGLLAYVLDPFRELGHAFLADVADFFFLGVIAFLVLVLLWGIRWIFRQAAAGNIRIPGVQADWAIPTYRIVRLVVVALAFVIAYPYIPGSGSTAFKGLSLFAGALFTIGSSAATGNFLGGLVLMFRGHIGLGDWIQVGDAVGEVVETSLILIRIRTHHEEIVTIPNVQVLASHFVNYSALAAGSGVILHSRVTIGYDEPWRKVHALLIEAAARTEGLEGAPAPFVLETSLENSYATYEINAYTRTPIRMPFIYGELHQNIQDVFAAAGVEILSPEYAALRRGLPSTVPKEEPGV
jgi:small-conductance mechanosensitive channel